MLMKNKYFLDGGFGIERETLRVDADGRLSQTPHPFESKHLERDFCENQLEIITPVCKSVGGAMDELARLSDYAENLLAENGECLWMYSNPPYFESEDEIRIANYGGENLKKREYRENLEKRYGKRIMLYSGIHFNFSLSDEYLKTQCGGGDLRSFKDSVYLKLFKYASRYSWLIVLLTSASPVYDSSLDGDGNGGSAFDGYSSRRSGKKGYWNCFVPQLDYESLERYAASVESYIDSGVLFSAGELYLPVRLKPRGENSPGALAKNGADHIELRMFDLNPLAPHGVFAEDLEFAHYFLLYLLSLPDFEYSHALQFQAVENHKAAARFELDDIEINGYPAADAARGILDDMRIYFTGYPRAIEIIDFQQSKLSGRRRYCDEVYSLFAEDYNRAALEKFTEKKGAATCASCSEQV
jgi:glutamate--cysteine ligase